MLILIRSSSFLLGLCVLSAPIYLSFLVAGIEPSRPFQFSNHLPFITMGIFLSAGYLGVTIFSFNFATFSTTTRWLISFLLVAPLLAAIYFLFVTLSGLISVFSITVIILAVWFLRVSVWPSSNPAFKRDAEKRGAPQLYVRPLFTCTGEIQE